MRAETYIAGRYLFRRGRKGPPLWLLGVSALLVVLSQLLVYSGAAQAVGALLTIPAALFFITCLFLRFFSVFITVSVLGVVMGVAALTVVLSVTSGFQASFRQKILGVNAHVLILKYGQDFSEYRDVMKTCAADGRVKAVAPFVFNQMMMAHGPQLSGLLVKGIDLEASPKVLDIADRIIEGKLSDLTTMAPANDGGEPLPATFIGRELKKKLKVKLGDRVRIVSPKLELDPQASDHGEGPPAREFRVAGVFYSGFDEYDRRLAYVNLPEAQAFYHAGDIVNGVEMKLGSVDDAGAVAESLTAKLGGIPYRVIDWEHLNHNLFTALFWQKLALTLFLGLIIIVAAFNIVAAITMLVVEKTKEVAILKSMGMNNWRVGRLFRMAGLAIGSVGALAGVGFGLLLCAVVAHYHYQLDPRVYLIDVLPVEFHPWELVFTVLATLVICLVATIYPSLRSVWLEPVEGLRSE